MLQKLRFFLFPLSFIYGSITTIRNYMYDKGIIKSIFFDINTLCVGNLSTGGTGKTPHCEYFINLYKNNKNIVLLSRGYGRKTKGFLVANENCTTRDIGDEPMQFYQKFKNNIKVCVCENRVKGVQEIQKRFPQTNLIILDDAFQHRAIKCKKYVLLTDYSKIYYNDFILPVGNLREARKGVNRANTVIVTKCQKDLSVVVQNQIKQKLKLKPYQELKFSYIKYNEKLNDGRALNNFTNKNITIVTGIANPKPLLNFLESKNINYKHIKFSDHHNFTESDIEKIKKTFVQSQSEIILTTEKDFTRLKETKLNQKNLKYIGISIEFI